jgi:hypothetical protein
LQAGRGGKGVAIRKRAGAKEKFLYGMRNVQKMLDEFEDNWRTDA